MPATLLRSLALVVSGAVAVVALGYLVGLVVPYDVVADTSSQVAGRIQPRLIDLLAALATGVVGSFALARADVSEEEIGVGEGRSLSGRALFSPAGGGRPRPLT